MRLGIITDIHADRAAFAAVLAAIATRKVDQLVFLGDLIGDGPDLHWCLDQVQDLVAAGALALRGNHDRYWPADHLSAPVRKLVDRTVNRLTARQKLFLAELPLTLRLGDVVFVHASPQAPQDWHYVKDRAAAEQAFAATDARVIVCGHTRQAALFAQGSSGVIAHKIAAGDACNMAEGRWLAVIQATTAAPKGLTPSGLSGAALAGFAVLEGHRIEFHQTRYDAAHPQMPLGIFNRS